MRHLARVFTVVATLLLVAAPPAWAASVATTPHFKAQLVPESLTPAAGSSLPLALVITPNEGWHTYWKNPGGTGFPPRLNWQLPAGISAGALQYPVPSELIADGIASNILEGRAIFLTRLHLPAGLKTGTRLPVSLNLNLLICSRGMCVPQSAALDLALNVGDGSPNPAARDIFNAARANLPTPLNREAHYTAKAKSLTLFFLASIAGPATKVRAFIANDGVMPAVEKVTRSDGRLAVSLPKPKLAKGQPVTGVLRVVSARGQVHGYSFAATAGGSPATSPGSSFWLALGAAILGGLLLNLMPCVFPILSLKALALARAGGNDAEARMEAIGYTLGAVAVLVALGAVVIVARSAGHAVGWAFQLQNPGVVSVLLLLVTAIATNLAGLFELPSVNFTVGNRKGLLGGMATGALAAFIATPCTGPFMAGALGAALLLPASAALAIFAGLGLGLALPFLCLGFIKPARRWLPRPGAWMLTLRRLLSLPMFATAVGLAWVVGRQAGVSAMTVSLSAAVLLGVGLWWYGLRQSKGLSIYPTLAPTLGAILLAISAAQTSAATTARTSHLLHSERYTAARLRHLRAEHRPVFVYLTADWCLTCKVNEATSLSATSVARAFKKDHVAVLEGDWTRGDPQVTKLLASRDRAGVPLYLWYPPQGPVKQLPQVLTPSMLVHLTTSGGA